MKNILKNFWYFFKLVYRLDKKYVIYFSLDVILKCISPFALVIFPKFILNEIMTTRRTDYIITYLVLMAITDIVINVLVQVTEPVINNRIHYLRSKMGVEFSRHILYMDYEYLENAKIMDLKQKAFDFIYSGLENITFNSQNFLIAAGRIIGYGAIIFNCNPVIIIIICLASIFTARLQGKIERYSYETEMEIVRPNRQGGYLDFICSDYSHVKDIRFNGITEWVLKQREKYNEIRLKAFKKICFKYVRFGVTTTFINNLLNIMYYLYLIYMLFTQKIMIGDFTMYLNAITNFSKATSDLFIQYARLTQSNLRLGDYIEFMSLNKFVINGVRTMNKKGGHKIEFRNVSFKYPNAESYSLKNVSVIINPNEKLSIIGENGAGKTTFIKLLLRIYTPTEGKIFLDGVDINEIVYEDYIDFFSVVFQDYHLFAFSIKENIAFQAAELEDNAIVVDLLDKVGLGDKIRKLKNGIDTGLSKQLDDDGTDISGGEKQKIAIARAIYRNSPIVILDEPTSALDPFAEYEIYKAYDKLIDGRTSLFISHRMASTRLSDRILVFSSGELIECGTHDELIQAGGTYNKMFTIQAEHYRD